jgi:replicative DNA helicase
MMSKDEKEKIIETVSAIMTGDNIQKFILGVKKSGHPRALYDILKDCVKYKKKKKKDKKKSSKNPYDIYLKRRKKKNKKNGKKLKKYWHI